MCRNKTKLFILTLYLKTLLNHLTVLVAFFHTALRYSIYKKCGLQIQIVYIFFSPLIYIPFFLLMHLSALTRASNRILIKTGQNRLFGHRTYYVLEA